MSRQDFVIIGGGIGGLWAFGVLRSLGFRPVLLSRGPLAAGQTIASQGMIHGGQRYTLSGLLTPESEQISAMPVRWSDALAGRGPVPLTHVHKLSEDQVLWAPASGSLVSGLTGVVAHFASKAMSTRTEKIPQQDYPEALRDSRVSAAFRLPESVLDVKGLVDALWKQDPARMFHAEVTALEEHSDGVRIQLQDSREIAARAVLVTAAESNSSLAESFGIKEAPSQVRPLRQILVKGVRLPLYGHAITVDPRPRLTVTAHPMGDGTFCWYLGGLVAAAGAEKTDREAIEFACAELEALFPTEPWRAREWSTLHVDRHEAKPKQGYLPEGPVLVQRGRVAIGWPTKLTFAPAFGDLVEAFARKTGAASSPDFALDLPRAEPALLPWFEPQRIWSKL